MSGLCRARRALGCCAVRRRPTLPRLLLSVLALCAVALLNMAVVESAVMQTAMSAESCREMSGHLMAGMPGLGGASKPSGKDAAEHRACAYCSAAAHAPLQACAPNLPASTAVTWAARSFCITLGPRGPPEREAHARGPPAASLTA